MTPLANATAAQALQTARLINTHRTNGSRLAAVLQCQPTLETSATGALLIAMGIAQSLTNIQKDWDWNTARNRLLQAVLSTEPQRRRREPATPLRKLAASLLQQLELRGRGVPLAQSLKALAMAHMASPHLADQAMEQLTPMRADRSAYHTAEPAATLLAHLCVPMDRRWENPNTLTGLRIADYACGCGTLLSAAYDRIRQLHASTGADPALVHALMLENSITGTDISVAPTALTAEALARFEPHIPVSQTKIVTLPYGPTNQGHPPALGALEILMSQDSHRTKRPRAWAPGSQDIIVMNPPYSRRINHAALSHQHTGPLDHQAMEDRFRAICAEYDCNPKGGPGPLMALLAIRNCAHSGTIGLILPANAVSDTSPPDPHSPWRSFRATLLRTCSEITVITTAPTGRRSSSFSHDSEVAEAMIIARKGKPTSPPQVRYVNLERVPATHDEAKALASRIRHALATNAKTDRPTKLPPGFGPDGFVQFRTMTKDAPWNNGLTSNPNIRAQADRLGQGILGNRKVFPTAPLGSILSLASSEAASQHAVEPYDPTYSPEGVPILNGHNAALDTSLQSRPPATLAPYYQPRTMPPSGRLHISTHTRFNSQATTACLTEEPSIGGPNWPAAILKNATKAPAMEEAMALWMNTTMGFIAWWHQATMSHNGRGYTSHTRLASMPVLDLHALSKRQLATMSRIYRDHATDILLPAHEAHRDPVRQKLDTRVLQEVLGANAQSSRPPGCRPARLVQRNRACRAPRGPRLRLRSQPARYRPSPASQPRKDHHDPATDKVELHLRCLQAALSLAQHTPGHSVPPVPSFDAASRPRLQRSP